MSTTPPETGAVPPQSGGEGGQATTVDELAKRQEQTDRKLDELIDLVKGAGPGGPGKKDGPGDPDPSLEARVREELARRDQAAADEQRGKEHADLKAQVAKLSEKPPRQPGSRRTKLLGWGDGR